jgi:hypothetical protein
MALPRHGGKRAGFHDADETPQGGEQVQDFLASRKNPVQGIKIIVAGQRDYLRRIKTPVQADQTVGPDQQTPGER